MYRKFILVQLRKYRADLIALAFVLIGAGLVVAPVLQDALLVSDDYEHHAVRTANYVLAIRQGQFPARWAPNANGGYGYPAFFYTYPLPYALAAGLHFSGLSIQESVNGVVVLASFAAVITAYLYARARRNTSFISAVLATVYLCNPYTLLCIFWRGALGELVFYSVLPLLLLSFERLLDPQLLSKRSRSVPWYVLLFTLSTATAVLSHLLSFVLLVVVLLTYGVVLLRKKFFDFEWLRERVGAVIVSSVLGLALTAWYWVPAVFERSLIRFSAVTSTQLADGQFISFLDLLTFWKTAESSEFFTQVVQLGIFPLTAMLLGSWVVVKKGGSSKNTSLLFLLLMLILFTVWVTPLLAPVWHAFPVLSMQQFPWRTLWLISLLAYLIVTRLGKWYLNPVVISILFLSAVFSVLSYAHVKGSTSRSDYEWYESIGTGSSFDEFRPRGAKEAASYGLKTPVVVLSGDTIADTAATELHIITGTRYEYTITSEQPLTVVQKTLYFPGWQVFVDGLEKVSTGTDVAPPEYAGLLQFSLEAGEHTVITSFTGSTVLRQVSGWVSLITAGVVLGILCWSVHHSLLRAERR